MAQCSRIDAGVFQRSHASRLCRSFAVLFQRAQTETGIEWRLLAAIAYQESQWDPLRRPARPACAG